jgi:predicted PurR-regulated permease PerM
MAKNIMPKLWAMLSDSIDFLFSIFASFIILLYIVFILLDYESIAEGWIHLLPVKYRGFVATLVSDMQKA